MAKQGMNIGLYLSGQPVQIQPCNIFVTQPKIKDIVIFGEDEFLIDINLLGHPEHVLERMRKGNSKLDVFSDFQLLMIVFKEEPTIGDSILKILNFLFPDYTKIEITESSIDFWSEEQIVGRVHPFNFEVFKMTINDLFEPLKDESEPDYNPANDAAAAIAEKIKKGRQRKAQQIASTEGPQSLFGRYTSILAVGMQMDINIFFNYTPFQLYDAFARYFSKVSCDLYTKVSTTPLMDVSNMDEPKEWVRNLYK